MVKKFLNINFLEYQGYFLGQLIPSIVEEYFQNICFPSCDS